MIKHIVMWTIKEGDTPRSKYENMAELKVRTLALKSRIKEIVNLDVYFNSPTAPADNFEVILIGEFNSWADLATYQKHPAHQEVVEFVKNVRQTRAAIDFEF